MSRARVRARGRKKERALGSSILFRLYERVDGWVVVEWTKEVLWFCWFGKVATSLFLTGKNPILLEFWFKIQIGSRPFFFMKCFLCDGRMVVVVVVDKKVLWFCSKFFRWSSVYINVRKFGKSAKNFFPRKKIQLQLSKNGFFLIKFRTGNPHFFLIFYFLSPHK